MLTDFKSRLNPDQLKAVQTLPGPLLILAGAGSGKTRVITYRIAYMLQKGTAQKSILAVTFTNKAAREMSKRIREITGKRVVQLTICTFHAFGVKVLREWSKKIGYRHDFSIFDQTDKQALIRELALERGLNKETLDLYYLSELFTNIKYGRQQWDEETHVYEQLYIDYNEHLKAYQAFDFDDLIVIPSRLFNEYPEILKTYQERYRSIMIDEFQDTSIAQYEFIKLIAQAHGNICVVGDDDQSIYSWRGAHYKNLSRFEEDFPAYTEIKLEQNYRSTKNILLAANKLIAHNLNRKQKLLWSGLPQGESISVYQAPDERAEGEYIARKIRSLVIGQGLTYDNIAVLVRTNYLTRALEEGLLLHNIPYLVSGGQSFYQRKEIKDIVSYLKVIANPDDTTNLLRIINIPHRGIGKQAIIALIALGEKESCSLYSAMCLLRQLAQTTVSKKTYEAIKDFVTLIEHYRELMLGKKKLALHLRSLVDQIDYFSHLLMQGKKESLARRKYLNIQSLINSLSEYEADPDNPDPSLYDYLGRITLLSRDDLKEEETVQKINLMTVHAAKGLEFDTVFIAACEQDIFPHSRSLLDGEQNNEEERRLFYVALTRAKRKLFLTSAAIRRKNYEVMETCLSPFILEIPKEIIEFDKEEKVLDKKQALSYFDRLKKNLSP
jgi:DNA helicase-2/ATP-dependent DNA helicase PcrA